MGNVPSSESPRRVPHKLSKPRRISRVKADDIASPSGLSACSYTRYSDSYLAASRAPSIHRAATTRDRPVSVGHAKAVTPISIPARPKSHRLSQTHVPRDTSGNKSTSPHGVSTVALDSRLRKARSVVYSSRGNVQPPTRAHSVSLHGYAPPQAWPPPNAVSSGSSHGPHVVKLTPIETNADSCQQAASLCASPNVYKASASPATPTDLDPSHYIPMRRRSLIQTPGVATRAMMDYFSPSPPKQPTIHISNTSPVTPTEHSPTTPTDDALLSLPVHTFASQYQERPITPTEANYLQLGGMKFGTLRITNGSPVPSPVIDSSGHASPRIVTSSSPPRLGRPFISTEPEWPLTSDMALYDDVYTSKPITVTQPKLGLADLNKALPSITVAPISDLGIQYDAQVPSPVSTVTTNHLTNQSDQDFFKGLHQQAGSSALAKGSKDFTEIVPEKFDIRQDPSARSLGHKESSVAPAKSLRGSIKRTDSGFVSISSSSSFSPRRTLSKADSGYGSSFSLRSSRSSSMKSQREKDRIIGLSHESSVSDKTRQNHDEESTAKGHHGSPVRSSFSLISRDTIRRLSTRSNRQRTASPSKPCETASGHVRSGSSGVGVNTLRNISEEDGSGLEGSDNGNKTLSGNTNMLVYPHDIPDALPAVPVDLEEKLNEHSTHLPTTPTRMALREKTSQSRLKTILSMESLNLHDSVAKHLKQDQGRESPAPSSSPPRPRGGASPERAADESSIHSATPPSRTVSRPSIRRKLIGSAERTLSLREGSTAPKFGPDTHHRHEPRKAVDDLEASTTLGVRRMLGRPKSKDVKQPGPELQIIRARASAPDLVDPLASLPLTMPPCPPIPQHLRLKSESSGMFDDRPYAASRYPSHSRSHSVIERSASVVGRRERMHSYKSHPSQLRGGLDASRQPAMRRSYSDVDAFPPVVYRQKHRRLYLDEQGQPYRILHSYNSPAYRHVPIWS